MTTDYVTYHQHLEERLVQLGRELPGPMTGFARLHKKAIEGRRAEPQDQGTDGVGDQRRGALRRLHRLPHARRHRGRRHAPGTAGNHRRSYPDGRRPGCYVRRARPGCH